MNNNISKKYIWVSFFKELSNKLLQFNNNRKELTKLINDVLVNLGDDVPDFTFDINPTSNEKIKDIYLDDIDPFTVFSLMVNAGEKKRKKVAKEYANIFYIKSQIPENFDGVPSNKRCNKMFYSFSGQDISRLKSIDFLWDLFEKILSLKNGDLSTICNEFDKVLKIKGIGVTMCTMALFWVAPERFISLDTPTKNYIYDSGMFPPRIISLLPEKRKIDFINAEDYISLIEIIKNYLISEDSKLKNFVELSAEAYKRAEKKKEFKKMDPITYLNKYSYDLIRSGNIIFHGAPGTGKTYLACNIAADIISDGKCLYADLSEELKKQIQFVQFHPSYDYTDFVEGLRPVLKDDDTMYFKLQPGIFKDFIGFARRNYELHVDTSEKTKEKLEKELYAMKLIDDYLSDIEINELNYSIQSGNKFAISEIDDEVIRVFVPENSESNKVKVDKIELRNMIASGKKFEKAKDIKKYFKNKYNRQCDSYLLAIYKQIILSKKIITVKRSLKLRN